MVRFFFKFDGDIFRARLPLPAESFTSSVVWKDELEFEMTESSMFMIPWTSLLPDLSAEEANALIRLVAARYPVSPDYEALRTLCPQIVVGFEASEWVFFGGSFHPWHKGHQACLNLLPEDKTCFVLPDRNPLKEVRQLHIVTTIIELSSRIRFKKNQFLVPSFLLNQKKNPTIEWIERLRMDYPDKKLSLLLGYDSVRGLSSWIRFPDLLKSLNTIYVVSRLEKDEEREKILAELKLHSSELQIVHLGRHEFEALSSTEIRKRK